MKAIFNMKSETIIVSDIKLFSKKKTKFLEKSFRSIPSKKKKKKKKTETKKKKKKKKKKKLKQKSKTTLRDENLTE